MNIPVLETARLRLRPFTEADVGELFTIRSDSAAMAHWDWPADRRFKETSLVALSMLEDMRRGNAAYWTARNAYGAFAGLFDLSDLAEPFADIGFMVPRCFWRQGYGYEGASALIGEARRRRHAGLRARIHAGNEGSAALLLLKLGFVERSLPEDVEVRPGVLVRCRFFELTLAAS